LFIALARILRYFHSMPNLARGTRFISPSLCFLLLLQACASSVSTADLREGMENGRLEQLEEKLAQVNEERGELTSALNLARVRQLQGRWRDSSQDYEQARRILEEYEQRAIVNVRGLAGSLGSVTLSRGSAGYYGAGYERALLHTLNSLNYLMQGDFSGAAVEIRRMELRQRLWLEEKDQRLRENLEKNAKEKSAAEYSGSNLPPGYSLAELLNDPGTREIMRGYQESFSYALGSLVCRLAGDADYAGVSLRRACALSPLAREMFSNAWGGAGKVPPPSLKPDTQEVTVILLGGLAPALRMEKIRIPNTLTGYLLIDLPAYTPPLRDRLEDINISPELPRIYPLLETDILAYRELSDEMDYEIGAAIGRAVTRAAVSIGGQALAKSNKHTADLAPLIGLFLTLGMDAYAYVTEDNTRNWETLPLHGGIGLGAVPRGSDMEISFAGQTSTVRLSEESRGIILLINQMGKDKVRIDHVQY
jgi:hypothetical protein